MVLPLKAKGNLWGTVRLGAWRVTVLRPHWGWAGPRLGRHVHTNVVLEKNGAKVRNWHIARYGQGCWYIFESVERTEWDTCDMPWRAWLHIGAPVTLVILLGLGGLRVRAVIRPAGVTA